MRNCKMQRTVISITLMMISFVSFSATLSSMTQAQVEHAIVNKTLISIPTDNLNGRTIDNTFSMFMGGHGVMLGSMSLKPANEPQTDQGSYTIQKDGTVYFIWQHWDGAKKLCAHFYNTQNAYLAVGCDQVFHTAYMKAAIQSGDHLKAKIY